MDFRVYFKHMDTSLPLYAYAELKLKDQLEKYELGACGANVTFAVEHGANLVHCHVMLANRASLAVEAEDDRSMYAAVDDLADRLGEKLRRLKDRMRSHRGPGIPDLQVVAEA